MFKFCSIDPIKFWVFTPAETQMMIQIAYEKYIQEYEFESTLAARLCAVVCNANGLKKKNKQPFEVNDFLPSNQKKNVPMTEEQAQEMMRIAVIKMGGEVK